MRLNLFELLARFALPLLPFMAISGGGRNRIEIVITALTRGMERGLRNAIGLVRGFGNTLRSIGSVASSVWSGITQGIFFTMNAMRELMNVARSLFDVLLGGAIDARRLEVTFQNMTGDAELASQMVEHLEETSEALGLRFEEVASTGQQLAVAAKDANGAFDINRWQELLTITQDFSALRPDVPLQLMARGVTAAASGDMSTLTRLLDVNVNQLLGLSDAADDVLAKGGQLQGIAEVRAGEMEATAEGGIDALNRLSDAIGATGLAETLAGEFEGVGGQLRAEFEDVAREFGAEVLPVLTEALKELLELFRDNEDEIEAFARNMGRFVSEAIEDVDWDQVGESAEKMATAIADADWSRAADAFDDIKGAIQAVLDLLDRIENNPTLNAIFNPETGALGAQQGDLFAGVGQRAEQTGAGGIPGLFRGQSVGEAFAHVIPPGGGGGGGQTFAQQAASGQFRIHITGDDVANKSPVEIAQMVVNRTIADIFGGASGSASGNGVVPRGRLD